jgi:hypothetical protein
LRLLDEEELLWNGDLDRAKLKLQLLKVLQLGPR